MSINTFITDAQATQKIQEAIGSIDTPGSITSNQVLSGELPYDQSKGILDVTNIVLLQSKLSFPSIAKGRETSEGAGDAPELPLTDEGYTHPSVFYLASGWCGYKYWLAITPTFGPTPDSSYENPHIFCSNDMITWIEPSGISNPIDLPPASPSNGYWSDTHLTLGRDGYLYCFYRGNHMPPSITNGIGTGTRVVVYKRSRNGIDWSELNLMYHTTGIGESIGIMSPAVINAENMWHIYDVVDANKSGYIFNGENQTDRVVMRRTSNDLSSGWGYTQDNVVNFKNRPWGESQDPWHLDAHKIGNLWILIINTGKVGSNTANDLYVAYSGDGWDFTVCQTPLSTGGRYRSCVVPKSNSSDNLEFILFENLKSDGSTNLKKFKLSYQ